MAEIVITKEIFEQEFFRMSNVKKLVIPASVKKIDEKQAERILARAKIQAVIDMIPSEQIQKSVAEWLDRSIIYE